MGQANGLGDFQKLLDARGKIIEIMPVDDEILLVPGADIGSVHQVEILFVLFGVRREDIAKDRTELRRFTSYPRQHVFVGAIAGENQQDRFVGGFGGLVQVLFLLPI